LKKRGLRFFDNPRRIRPAPIAARLAACDVRTIGVFQQEEKAAPDPEGLAPKQRPRRYEAKNSIKSTKPDRQWPFPGPAGRVKIRIPTTSRQELPVRTLH
jgi:hypothetical protein